MREGPPRAYRPIMFQDGPGFQNHWAFEECPIEEAGRRKDQRKDGTLDTHGEGIADQGPVEGPLG